MENESYIYIYMYTHTYMKLIFKKSLFQKVRKYQGTIWFDIFLYTDWLFLIVNEIELLPEIFFFLDFHMHVRTVAWNSWRVYWNTYTENIIYNFTCTWVFKMQWNCNL